MLKFIYNILNLPYKFSMKLNKFWIALTWFLAVAWVNEAKAQTKVYWNTQEELYENLWQNETLIRNKADLKEIVSHDEFINTNIFELKEIYWKEKCLQLINKHALIEINNIRRQHGKPEIKIDENLREFSQKRAKYLFENQSLSHWEWEDDLAHRLNRSWIFRTCCWENLWQWQMTVKRIVQGWMWSNKHKKLLLDEYIQLMWLWVDFTNIDEKTFMLCSTRVLTAIWNN